ncbi:hypothetical protein SLEP1_g49552 [Rubroshorea leprosula]|uniref:TRF2/HOY1 PH-like domain-containing protein n=1 Tax=Rubroshorea leprosula TaxID=152421 RepID=A0AAV5LX57_9ROSI|nr:hypothetical protein SLEP1_g49552 [Rubroshorea leprosula]
MVQLMSSGNHGPDRDTSACRDKLPVKLEIAEDPLEEEYGPLDKRSKADTNLHQVQWNSDSNGFPIPPSQYNPLEEPSPLGLRLRKSPSLLELIQMRLSQSQGAVSDEKNENFCPVQKKETKSIATTDKLKASNFPASILRIGSWEYKSRYEGDLVAKCYFAKHKLVWEVLENGLKSKIEIQWSDIMAIKANCPDNGPGTLNVVLARQPLFFKETNPQPRKHTLWQAASDFTDGQASKYKQHFLQCPQGMLNRHFEKLIQCDMRLNFLSQQPEITLDSPCFESRTSIFEDPSESKGQDLGQVNTGKGTSSGFQNLASPAPAQSSSLEIENGDSTGVTSEPVSREAPSPSSVMDTVATEGSGICEAVDSKGPRDWDQIIVPGLHPSMSMSDLINHIEQQMVSGNPSSENTSERQEMLEEIAQYLLSDTQFTTASDEKSLMSRVNSLCCLLQKDNTAGASFQVTGEGYNDQPDDEDVSQLHGSSESMLDNISKVDIKASEGDTKDASCSKPVAGMSRKDSLGDFLIHLPRIASLPKFLFNISEEDGQSQAR